MSERLRILSEREDAARKMAVWYQEKVDAANERTRMVEAQLALYREALEVIVKYRPNVETVVEIARAALAESDIPKKEA
jgi:hypothetical protein